VGFNPFAGLLPQPGDAPSFLDGRIVGTTFPLHLRVRHGISAASGPRVVRAPRPPRFIFVGVTDRLRKNEICKGGRPGLRWRRLLGFAPVCGPFPRRTFGRGSFLPWALPLAGFSGALLRIRTGTSPFGSPVPGLRTGRLSATTHRPIRSWVFGEPSRSEMSSFESCSTVPTCCLRGVCCLSRASPSLQRIDEADALPVRSVFLRGRSDRLPV
jgi:hypothetical protein